MERAEGMAGNPYRRKGGDIERLTCSVILPEIEVACICFADNISFAHFS